MSFPFSNESEKYPFDEKAPAPTVAALLTKV